MNTIAVAWALSYAGFGAFGLVRDRPLLFLGHDPLPVATDWVVVVAAAVTVMAALRARECRRSRLWAGCAFVLVGLGAFGALMDVITLLVGQGVDDATAATTHAWGLAGTFLLFAIVRPALPAAASFGAPPVPTPRSVRRLAYAGMLALVPYAAMKQVWAWGGTFAGMSGDAMLAAARRNGASGVWLGLERVGVDATVLMGLCGALLLGGLVRPWGLCAPRWLLLVPAVVGSTTLVPYGCIGLAYVAAGTAGLARFPRGDFPTVGDALLVSWVGLTAFGVYGVALACAAHSYWRRTRVPCAVGH